MVKYKGTRGKWSVDVKFDDGTELELPCLHKIFWPRGDVFYEARNPSWDEHWDRHVKLIDAVRQHGMMVMTDDEVEYDKRGQPIAFKRRGYVGVYAVRVEKFDKDELVIKMLKRVA